LPRAPRRRASRRRRRVPTRGGRRRASFPVEYGTGVPPEGTHLQQLAVPSPIYALASLENWDTCSLPTPVALEQSSLPAQCAPLSPVDALAPLETYTPAPTHHPLPPSSTSPPLPTVFSLCNAVLTPSLLNTPFDWWLECAMAATDALFCSGTIGGISALTALADVSTVQSRILANFQGLDGDNLLITGKSLAITATVIARRARFFSYTSEHALELASALLGSVRVGYFALRAKETRCHRQQSALLAHTWRLPRIALILRQRSSCASLVDPRL
jgi:hypothetical protein